jgi:hypothetical protein
VGGELVSAVQLRSATTISACVQERLLRRMSAQRKQRSPPETTALPQPRQARAQLVADRGGVDAQVVGDRDGRLAGGDQEERSFDALRQRQLEGERPGREPRASSSAAVKRPKR